jgi:hypothetical protein
MLLIWKKKYVVKTLLINWTERITTKTWIIAMENYVEMRIILIEHRKKLSYAILFTIY